MSLMATVAANAVNSFVIPPSYLGDLSVANGNVAAGVTTTISNLSSTFPLAITPDGLFVYSNDGNIYTRNTSTGILAQSSTFTGLGWDIVISSDGNFVYMADGNQTVYQYSRNTSTGALTALSTPTVSTGQTTSRYITISPDGTSLYVVNTGSSNISQYTRNTSTGLLTAMGTPTVAALSAIFHLVISPDGTSAYITGGDASGPSAILQFTRNTSTGALTANGDIINSANPIVLAVSADGLFVYGSGGSSTTLYIYTRNTSTGVLTLSTSQTVPQFGIQSNSITLTSDNNYAYLSNVGYISQYSRNTSTGALVPLGTPSVYCQSVSSTLFMTPDNSSIYYFGTTNELIYGMARNSSTGLLTQISATGPIIYFNYVTTGSFDNAVISSDGLFVYLVNGSSSINTLSRNTSTGAVMQINTTAVSNSSATLVDVVISPDGTSTYAVDSANSLVWMFSRNTSTGTITALGTASISTGTSSIRYTTIIKVSPDGTSVYVVNSGSNQISQYSRNTSTGALTAMGTPTVSTGNAPFGLVISPDGTSTYATNQTDSTISQFSRNTSTGALSALGTPTVGTGSGPYGISISPDGAFVYCLNNSANSISLFTRNTSTGALTVVTTTGPTATSVGTTPDNVVVSSDGLYAYVVNSASATISQFSRNTSTGALTPLGTPTVSTGTTPKFMTISPDGTSAYVANSGSGNVSQYTRNTSTGLLTAMGTPTVTVASTAWSIVISADGQYAYVITDVATASAKVYQYSRNTSTGALTALSTPSIAAGNKPNSICVSADNNNVYVLNGSANTVQTYSRNTSTGLLTSVTTIASNAGGVGLVISPDGTSVYVANAASQVTGFTRNTSSGALSANANEGIPATATGIAISPDGAFVYVSHSTMSCISLLRRNTSNGVLTFLTTFPASGSVTNITVSSDGLSVYTTNSTNNVCQYTRDPISGALSGSGTVPLVWIAPGAGSIGGLTITPDGKTMYVQSTNNDTIFNLDRSIANGTLRLAKIPTLTTTYQPSGMICSPDNNQLFICGGNYANAYQRALK